MKKVRETIFTGGMKAPVFLLEDGTVRHPFYINVGKERLLNWMTREEFEKFQQRKQQKAYIKKNWWKFWKW